MTPAENRTVTHEASDIVFGDRQDDYGHPYDNFTNIANFWNDWLRATGREPNLTYRDVAYFMELLKVARDANRPKRDNMVDRIGYIAALELADEKHASLQAEKSEVIKSHQTTTKEFGTLRNPLSTS